MAGYDFERIKVFGGNIFSDERFAATVAEASVNAATDVIGRAEIEALQILMRGVSTRNY